MSNLSKIENYIRNYEDSLRKMNDNRLRVEFNFVSNHINIHSGRPAIWKIKAIISEARLRGLR